MRATGNQNTRPVERVTWDSHETVYEGRPGRIAQLEPYLSWQQLGAYLGGASKRWLEDRVRERMPSTLIAGKRCFQLSQVAPWLREHGYIEDQGDRAA